MHSGFHCDSVITKDFPPFDTSWLHLRMHNPFMNDMHGHLCTECGMESLSKRSSKGCDLCNHSIHSRDEHNCTKYYEILDVNDLENNFVCEKSTDQHVHSYIEVFKDRKVDRIKITIKT